MYRTYTKGIQNLEHNVSLYKSGSTNVCLRPLAWPLMDLLKIFESNQKVESIST